MKVILKDIDEKGFYIDEAFVEAVKSKVRSKKKREVIDGLLCAQIVAHFLSTHEETPFGELGLFGVGKPIKS